MKIEIVERPEKSLVDFFDRKIEEFNVARWEIKEKNPLAVKVESDAREIIAGGAGKTFGLWLLIDNLWVKEEFRGKDLGTKILLSMESAARNRGCGFSLLDTLDFQARPFYEKHGYKLQWVQENYPKDGRKFFMVKDLSS